MASKGVRGATKDNGEVTNGARKKVDKPEGNKALGRETTNGSLEFITWLGMVVTRKERERKQLDRERIQQINLDAQRDIQQVRRDTQQYIDSLRFVLEAIKANRKSSSESFGIVLNILSENNVILHNNGQVGVIGENAHIHDNKFNQVQVGKPSYLGKLAKEMAELRQEIKKEGSDSLQADVALGEIANVLVAIEEKNMPKLVEHLKSMQRWTLDFAQDRRKNITIKAIKSAMEIS